MMKADRGTALVVMWLAGGILATAAHAQFTDEQLAQMNHGRLLFDT